MEARGQSAAAVNGYCWMEQTGNINRNTSRREHIFRFAGQVSRRWGGPRRMKRCPLPAAAGGWPGNIIGQQHERKQFFLFLDRRHGGRVDLRG